MKDLEIILQNKPGALAEMGETLGAAGVSLEGGGLFVHDGIGIAHFLVEDAEKGKEALGAKGIRVAAINEVLVQKLKQGIPGQLGKICRLMEQAGVNILVQYSDHSNQLILVVDDIEKRKNCFGKLEERNLLKGYQPKDCFMSRQHNYKLTITWRGNTGTGTSTYRSYERSHSIAAENKHEILASSDPVFRGDKTKYNPEELLLGALSGCHMLSYLHLCAVAGVVVIDYVDQPTGVVTETPDGGGHFTEAHLNPVVTVTESSMIDKANELHQRAHELCFIASSVNFPVRHHPIVIVESAQHT